MGIQGGNLSNLSLSPDCIEEITECYIPLVSHFSKSATFAKSGELAT